MGVPSCAIHEDFPATDAPPTPDSSCAMLLLVLNEYVYEPSGLTPC